MDDGIGGWIPRRALLDGDRTAIVDAATGVRTTFRELDERTNRVADALRTGGVRPGDRVAMLLLNGPEFVEILFGVAKLGAVAVPMNYRLAAPEIGFLLVDSGARVLFVSDALAALAQAALQTAGTAVCEAVTVPTGATRSAPSPYAEMVAGGSPAPDPADVAAGDVAMIMYTSGTTGRPKGAMLTHGNLLWNVVNSLTAGSGLHRADRTVTPAPLFHIGGLGVHTLPLLYAGGYSVLMETFDPAELLRLVEAERATVQFLVPAMWAAVMTCPDVLTRDLSSLATAISGGAPCPLPVIEFFVGRGVAFMEGFGMTETAPGVLMLEPEFVTEHAGSAGRVLMHTHVEIMDDRHGVVPVGEVGELVVRGPNVFAGYWGLPAETAEAFRGGWFHTGDLARIDAEGFVTLVDRKKDMIITGGENVYPIEVEQVLYRHPDIAEVAVVGVPDLRWGEAVVAVVVPAPGRTPVPAEIVVWVRGRLAHFKCPRRVEVVAELPRNATGKVLKRTLRQIYGGHGAAVTR